MRKRLPIREGILGLGGGPFHISISKAKLREIDRVPPGAWEGGGGFPVDKVTLFCPNTDRSVK